MNLLKDLESVFSIISIYSNFQISIEGQPIFHEYLFIDDLVKKKSEAIRILALEIYERAYLNKSQLENDIPLNCQSVLKSNKNKKWTKSCKVIFVDADESLIIEKNNYRKRVFKGQFIRKTNYYEEVKINDKLDFYHPTDNFHDNKPYLIIYGNQFFDNIDARLYRYYFNIDKKGICFLTELITDYFNKYKYPYEIKFSILKTNYQRADNAVLYVGSNLNSLFLEFIFDNYWKLSSFLNPKVPLFTKKIQNGIGFAESPNFTNDSFGISRCTIIAEAIIESIYTPNMLLKDFVVSYILKRGFNQNNFHLNPMFYQTSL